MSTTKQRGTSVGPNHLNVTAPLPVVNATHTAEERLLRVFRSKLTINEQELQGVSVEIAHTREDLEAAYRLVHDSYVCEGYMDAQSSGMRLSIHNSIPGTTTFVVKVDGEVTVTMSILPDSFVGLPMDCLYREELAPLRASGQRIGEAGLFATKPGTKRANPTVVLALISAVIDFGLRVMKLDSAVITVNPKHRLFYKAAILFEELGSQKAYGSVKGAAAVALRLDVRTFTRRCCEAYAHAPREKNVYEFMQERTQGYSWSEIGQPATTTTMNSELVEYFFAERTSVFSSADPAVVARIRSMYCASTTGSVPASQRTTAAVRYLWPVISLHVLRQALNTPQRKPMQGTCPESTPSQRDKPPNSSPGITRLRVPDKQSVDIQ